MGWFENVFPSSQPKPSKLSPELQEEEHLAQDWSKIQVMDHLRLMQDNQRDLNTVSAADRAHRAWHQRTKESGDMAGKGIDYPDDSMSTYRIDSPDSHHHHYPPKPSSSVLPWALAAALASGAGVYGYLASKTPVPAPTPIAQPAPRGHVWDEIEQQQQPDGTWRATGKTSRKRMGADGAVETQQPDGLWKKD